MSEQGLELASRRSGGGPGLAAIRSQPRDLLQGSPQVVLEALRRRGAFPRRGGLALAAFEFGSDFLQFDLQLILAPGPLFRPALEDFAFRPEPVGLGGLDPGRFDFNDESVDRRKRLFELSGRRRFGSGLLERVSESREGREFSVRMARHDRPSPAPFDGPVLLAPAGPLELAGREDRVGSGPFASARIELGEARGPTVVIGVGYVGAMPGDHGRVVAIHRRRVDYLGPCPVHRRGPRSVRRAHGVDGGQRLVHRVAAVAADHTAQILGPEHLA